ncbi:hypothetical protein H257_11672 [Aphanomyces astaci]|uniref:EGF-like domain-containing protein n=1 Tax=Aphanomyces astaci TaxID=112090 RepID=W4G1H5_APHAT|nr:hypothetical protein H257_11672 [Aphanomyces astaci]ETV73545.1 hypothetical protein H257_11672 [Aphanomyces astaci]|eukprot:XP_009836971.1 hypothetical protein H257_11672 [Aphanomyces astaci]
MERVSSTVSRSHPRSSSLWMFFLCYVILITSSGIDAQVTAADSTDSCCATCLAQPRVGSADALDFTACAAAQTTCCFDKTCQPATFGPPTYDLTLMTFADTETRFPAGNWLRMQWTTAVEVKYLALKTGQPKTTQVTNASVAATPKGGGFFFVCPALEGKLYLRAFAHNGCTASNELSITITAGNGSTCSEDVPTAPIQSGDCDAVRGAMLNGVCTCLEDFAGPPQCLSNSFWKRWGQIITYAAGGLSTITAMFGFYRFYKMRQATKDNNRRSVMAAAATTPLPTNHPTGRSTSPQYTDAVHMTTPPVPTKKQLSFRDFHHVPTSQHAPLTQVRLAVLSSMDDRQHRAPSPLRYDDDEESLRSSVSDGVLLAGYHHDAETADGRTSHEFTL